MQFLLIKIASNSKKSTKKKTKADNSCSSGIPATLLKEWNQVKNNKHKLGGKSNKIYDDDDDDDNNNMYDAIPTPSTNGSKFRITDNRSYNRSRRCPDGPPFRGVSGQDGENVFYLAGKLMYGNYFAVTMLALFVHNLMIII